MAMLAPLALGTAATAATATTAATAATAGLFGTAGAFSAMTTLGTLASGLGVLGALQSGNASQASAQAQQQQSEYNAKVAENNATMAREQANAREETLRRNMRIQQGSARAGMAQSGLGMTGSLLDVYDQSAMFAEMDALNTRYEGEVQARGLVSQAQQERYSGSVAAANGKAAKTASWLNAGSSLLAGVSRYGEMSKLRAA